MAQGKEFVDSTFDAVMKPMVEDCDAAKDGRRR
jgi:hypothetical protein